MTQNIEQARQHLSNMGFSSACNENLYGACLDGFTLFIELDEENEVTRGWMVDAKTFEFVGPSYEVVGNWVTAAEHVRASLQDSYDFERNHGGSPRSFIKHPEHVTVQ